jgi:formylglycine-generating enzyme required for sulfatase activity
MFPLLLALAFADGPFDGLEDARRPQKLEPFWYGVLPAQASASSAAGIVALRVPRSGRVRIPGGKFVMGSTPQEMQEGMQLCAKEPLGMICLRDDETAFWTVPRRVRAEGHAHEVTLSDFELDVTEVTVERYQRCVSAGICGRPGFPTGDPRFALPNLPVTHVSWDDAASYCQWVGGRLPTEAEWEYTARGRVNNTFPWGKVWNPHLANHGAYTLADTRLSYAEADASDGYAGLAPVGSFPDGATPTGVLDLAGNAAEWVADFYDRVEEQFGYAMGAVTNPRIVAFSQHGHVIRGGSYETAAWELRSAARFASRFPSPDLGFRCAADVTPR